MFERFSERARRVMLLADQAAIDRGSELLRTEHLLYAMLKDDAGVGSSVLHELEADFQALHHELQRHMPRPAAESEPAKIALSPHVKNVVQHAIDEARHLNHVCVGTEHLLLGMLRETEGVACAVLTGAGLRLERVRDKVRELLDQP